MTSKKTMTMLCMSGLTTSSAVGDYGVRRPTVSREDFVMLLQIYLDIRRSGKATDPAKAGELIEIPRIRDEITN
jgi:hypothetical protein